MAEGGRALPPGTRSKLASWPPGPGQLRLLASAGGLPDGILAAPPEATKWLLRFGGAGMSELECCCFRCCNGMDVFNLIMIIIIVLILILKGREKRKERSVSQ